MNKLFEIMQKFNLTYGIMDFSDIQSLIECRAKSRLPKNPRSVICCIFPYNVGELAAKNVSSYAVIPDYHSYVIDTLSKICDELSRMYKKEFVCFSDISPIPEVFCAVKSGLGFRGKNNLLITKEYGSYVVLGEIVTEMEFPPTGECKGSCLSCGKCEKSCPNHAIGHKQQQQKLQQQKLQQQKLQQQKLQHGIDYSRCLSKISQRKGELTEEEKSAMKSGGLAWGCDRCQEVCPHNEGVKTTNIPEFLNDIEPILSIENMEKLMKTRAYGYKGRVVLERNLKIINNPTN